MRGIMIVLDGVGMGALPDAGLYGDDKSATLRHVLEAAPGFDLPRLGALGLGNIVELPRVPPHPSPRAFYGKMAARSPGKDSTSGHWELAGLVLDAPFPLYPHGFPADLIASFEKAVGRKVLGNLPASGTEIIERLGKEHLSTGSLIVYTSGDSVFQIAAHEEVISQEELYGMCEKARALCRGEHALGRVIARPFKGSPGSFVRTAGRRDFSLPPPGPTLLDRCGRAKIPVKAIGKIKDLFAGQGITDYLPSTGNTQGMEILLKEVKRPGEGLLLINLVDFDMLYGHRNDPKGFAAALQEFDRFLPLLEKALQPKDLVLIVSDHGNDPTTPGTDHTREYALLLALGPTAARGGNLGTRSSFADAGATLAEHLGLPPLTAGESFYLDIARRFVKG